MKSKILYYVLHPKTWPSLIQYFFTIEGSLHLTYKLRSDFGLDWQSCAAFLILGSFSIWQKKRLKKLITSASFKIKAAYIITCLFFYLIPVFNSYAGYIGHQDHSRLIMQLVLLGVLYCMCTWIDSIGNPGMYK